MSLLMLSPHQCRRSIARRYLRDVSAWAAFSLACLLLACADCDNELRASTEVTLKNPPLQHCTSIFSRNPCGPMSFE
eukprot:UN3809